MCLLSDLCLMFDVPFFPGVRCASDIPPVRKSVDSAVTGLLPAWLPHRPPSRLNLRPCHPSNRPREWSKDSGRRRQWKPPGEPATEAPIRGFRGAGRPQPCYGGALHSLPGPHSFPGGIFYSPQFMQGIGCNPQKKHLQIERKYSAILWPISCPSF